MRRTKWTQPWIEALESGEYRQGRNTLCRSDKTYCCLGVGASIMGVLEDEHAEGKRGYVKDADGLISIVSLPDAMRDALGLDASDLSRLVELNDLHHFTFPEIAAVLRGALANDTSVELFCEQMGVWCALAGEN